MALLLETSTQETVFDARKGVQTNHELVPTYIESHWLVLQNCFCNKIASLLLLHLNLEHFLPQLINLGPLKLIPIDIYEHLQVPQPGHLSLRSLLSLLPTVPQHLLDSLQLLLILLLQFLYHGIDHRIASLLCFVDETSEF